jgi:sialate O-acetylesterase
MKKTIVVFLAFIFSCSLFANVTLPKVFSDNMVLQRNKPIHIWGWAAAGEKVTVKFHDQQKTTKADKAGKWEVMLSPEEGGVISSLQIQGKNNITLNNVAVGEVWICSGQSNMEMPIAGWGKINNYEQEIAAAVYPAIRHIKVPNTVSTIPQDDISGGEWKVCNPANTGEFSSTAYFFARELYKKLNVPIGLINTSWGGTQSEAWTSQHAFEQSEHFKPIAQTMHTSDFQAMVKERNEKVLANIKKAQGSFDPNTSTADWKNSNYDDSQWPLMQLPSVWEDRGFPGLDGIVWFRRTIDIAAADAGQQAVIELAKIDDIDETYINGVKVGGMPQWDELRKYPIPAGVLKPGKNVIAVKVQDDQGGGGIYGDDFTMKLTIGNKVQALTGDWKFRIESILNKGGNGAVGPNDYPSLLFNAMINPLLPYTIRGAIWYQGEANVGRSYEYRDAFPLMINDWRRHWKQGDFPFIFVQLSTFGSADANSNNGSNWAELREAQAMTLSLPNTGMAVTTDIGNPKDIHPKNKQDVGKRLATIALHDVYAIAGEYTGPLYKSMKTTGNRIELSFDHTGSGWLVKDKDGYIKGFEIAGTDKKFHFAKAMTEGDKIIVWNESVQQPVAVRYNWSDDASEGNLYNKEFFPAAPFRTDDWPGVTIKNKYAVN